MSLLVSDVTGRVLLHIDDFGDVIHQDDTIVVENKIRQRIAAAAGGGLDIHHLPDDLNVIYCGDVRLNEVGTTSLRGAFIDLTLLCDDLPVLQKMATQIRAAVHDLEKNGNVLRAVIFVADQVNFEFEPRPDKQPPRTEEQTDLVATMLMQPPAWERLFPGEDPPDRVKPALREPVLSALAEAMGFESYEHVPTNLIVMFATDCGLAHLLPTEWTGLESIDSA